MTTPNKFLIEGIDRLGKDTLIKGIQNRNGYHLVLHYSTPLKPECYRLDHGLSAERQYQEASFRTMFQLLRDRRYPSMICNRAHLGECVYAPLYRGYPGEYVFDIERAFNAHKLPRTRLILLTEDFDTSSHFVDDRRSLGSIDNRRKEQELFLKAFENSTIKDKMIICVTDQETGRFKPTERILNEVLS
jgi:hypothetical protein